MPQPALQLSAHLRYVDSIAATLERVVAERVPRLVEPTAVLPEHAFKIVGLVVETIAGFVIGSVAGELARGLRRWAGVDADLTTCVHEGVAPGPLTIARRFLADADRRPLVDELGARLQPRLRLAIAEIRALVEAVIALVPEDRPRAAATMFDRLIADSMFGDLLAESIGHGWCCARAAIERAPTPALAGSARSRALWQRWSELAGLSRPPVGRTSLEAAGYIMLVR